MTISFSKTVKIVFCVSVIALAHGASAAPAFTFTGKRTVAYNRDIRPILAEHCFACHGPDSGSRKAGLRLDRFEDATAPRDGGAAIVPGKLEKSLLTARILTKDEDDVMPPPSTKKQLGTAQIELLQRWVAEGAQYEPHWSFIAPVRPVVPAVKDAKWARNPIDRFILARIEQAGLKPAPEADRRTLARRLSLDLTGLPPAPAEVEAFVADKSPDAYEKLVDRLMASPHWGEHRGRYWLDAARYADTHGIHFDNYREMWAYRDWVINAFTRNLPFDQFTVEQLAGDLLPARTEDQLVATGFVRCNITTNEGGIIDEDYRVLYARDRTETFATIWLGATVGCAVCHDHKFDPITARDFYSLSAFFNNSTQPVRDGNKPDPAPVISIIAPSDKMRWAALEKEIPTARESAEARKKAAGSEFGVWAAKVSAVDLAKLLPTEGLAFHAPLDDGNSNTVKAIVAGQPREWPVAAPIASQAGRTGKAATVSATGIAEVADAGDFETKKPFTVAAWVRPVKDGQTGAIVARMGSGPVYAGWDLWLDLGKPGMHLIQNWEKKSAVKIVASKALPVNQWSHVLVTYDGSGKAAGVAIYVNGELQAAAPRPTDTLAGSIRSKAPFTLGRRSDSSALEGAGVQEVRLYTRAVRADEAVSLAKGPRLLELAGKPAEKRSAGEKEELFQLYLSTADQAYLKLQTALANLESEQAAVRKRSPVTHVMNEAATVPMAYILSRGEYDKRRDQVPAATPAVLPPMPAGAPTNRLGLAQWLLRPEQPLTTRVTVNRFWQELFGSGLVRSASDFGITGELPSHPELLDWIAVEFRESGWDMKRFFKLLVTSSAYRQAATVTKETLAKDPENRLIARGPRFRMDAEMVRDYALAASGLISAKIGGPSVKPYQPDGVWEAVAMIGSNTRDYKRDSGESLYRRSLYTFWKRSAPPASMEIFNAPNRENCAVRRERTNTPLQALVTLNDPQFIEAARHLAQRALQEGGAKPEATLEFMARRVLSRPLRSEEIKPVNSVLKDLLAHYEANPKEAAALIAVGESKADPKLAPPALAAYTMLANQLLNLDEVLSK